MTIVICTLVFVLQGVLFQSVVTIPGYDRLSRHPLISIFVRGIFNRHSILTRYTNIWDLSTLLVYYDNMPSNKDLEVRHLCKKAVVSAFNL